MAMRRLSTRLLVDWLDKTHEDYIRCLERLDLHADAIFPVSWAGETRSPNWFHIAREYTEKWHHQQQIWDAVKKPGILTPEFYPLVLETFMKALPFRYRDLAAMEGTILEIIIPTEAGGRWQLQHTKNQWSTVVTDTHHPDTVIIIPLEVSWKLFTKAMTTHEAREKIRVDGDNRLAEPLLHMITVMA